ncbi:winged helix-turn-helix domain-containing protein [Methanolobus sp. ZRKC2]|uniref:helix-turn-helix transcriptional regulator n=2 Tax=unclassified Methanolobus TaxID=2629569 RepID=UPI00324E4E1E
MQSSLVNLVWLSEKRRHLLDYLQEGPKDIEEIKSFFDITSRLIIPEIKKLIKTGIIVETEGSYKLSTIGKLNLEHLNYLIDTAELVELDPEFWENSDLTPLPRELYHRIGELRNSTIYTYDLDDIFDCPTALREKISTARDILIFMPFLPPTHPSIFIEPLKRGVNISMVFTKPIMEKMKREFTREYEEYLKSPNCQLFTCEADILRPMIVAMDNFLLLGFFKHNGIYGNKELMSHDKRAIEWGRDLCQYYISISESVE